MGNIVNTGLFQALSERMIFQKVNAERTELNWTHYSHLFKVEDEKACLWYQEEALVPDSGNGCFGRRF